MRGLIGGIVILGIACISGCATNRQVISGEFGTVKPPSGEQVAEVTLKSGNILLARKIQQEDDSLYVVDHEFVYSAIPQDSVSAIRIRGPQDAERVDQKTAISEEEKAVLADAGLRVALWAAVFVPLLIIGWFVSDVVVD